MNKTAIKNFAVEARKKLIKSIELKAGLLGITKDGCISPVQKGDNFEIYKLKTGIENKIYGEQIKQRAKLAAMVQKNGFDNVVEAVAYTWFNRIIAVRFMEVNDYLPSRIRVLSSETENKTEPDIITDALNIDLGLNEKEKQSVYDCKVNNNLGELFNMLFIKQCNKLNEILPELFQETDDYTELLFSISFNNKEDIVRMLVDTVPEEDFKEAVEIIGWMYQYYNTEPKDETFTLLKKNVKITRENIPAATQLFTPDWIVKYMVENSLGRLWTEKCKAENTECKVKDTWHYYLDEALQTNEVEEQLIKIREKYKNIRPEEIKIIDPCMGSGHILVYVFDVLMDIYVSCGYDEREAAKLIVEKNIYGFDIDYRAYQLAYFAVMIKYFAVMMKNGKYHRRNLNAQISHNLSLSYSLKPENYAVDVANHIIDKIDLNCDKEKLKEDIKYLLHINEQIGEYGSIVDVKMLDYNMLEEAIETLGKKSIVKDFNNILPIIKQCKVLGQKYDVVVTNPPYMGSSGMNLNMSDYVKKNYSDSKSDLFAVFIEKCSDMLKEYGYQAMITQHAWMFLSSYEKLRSKLVQKDIVNMAHLGARAFEEIGGEVVQTTSFVLRNSNIKDYKSTYVRLVDYNSQKEKENEFLSKNNLFVAQKENFSKIPGMPIAYWVSENGLKSFNNDVLGKTINAVKGLDTCDNDKFVREWYEIDIMKIGFDIEEVGETYHNKWFPYCKGGGFKKWFGFNEKVVNWENDGNVLRNIRDDNGKIKSRPQNTRYYFKKGITWSTITSNKLSMRIMDKSIFGGGGSAIFLNQNLNYIFALLNSKLAEYFLSLLNPTLNFLVGDIKSLPIIWDKKWKQQIENTVLKNVSISKTDWDSFETSWDFARHPLITFRMAGASAWGDNKPSLRISSSYKAWELFAEGQFQQLKQNEEELNRIFIDIYGLQDELTPEVENKDVTIRKADLNRDMRSFVSYAVGCMFGRYSLDMDGLAYAGGEWDDSKYTSFIPDRDNIIPITDTEYFNDDIVTRFAEFVKTVYGAETLEENLDFIASSLGNKGDSSREKIRNYFLKDFYKDHVKIYQKRPIYWLFDSGKSDGFKALIYMHRYNEDTVTNVRFDYLHKTQTAIEESIKRTDDLLDSDISKVQKNKTMKEKEKLIKQLSEISLYDQAIAHIAAKRISIDLDDGVKVNYEKFQEVEVSNEGKKTQKIDLIAKI